MNRFKKYDIVRHFKYETLNDEQKKANVYVYQIINPSVSHTETGEKLVVYKALYNGRPFGLDVELGQTFARPANMFNSKVDHIKYPDIKQTNRFEFVKHLNTEIHGDMISTFDLNIPHRKKEEI